MSFLEEIKAIKDHLLLWLIVFLVVSFAIFTISFSKGEIFGYEIYFPVFSSHSLAVTFFETAKNDLVPEGVILIATSPTASFISQMTIALAGALIVTFPLLIYKIFQYLSPALYKKERRAALKALVPSTILFVAGALFSYFILIPPTFKILYSFNATLGVAPFFAVNEFIGWTFALMFMAGIMFLLPVFMFLLSRMGMVPPSFWGENWRGALVTFLLISAIVTPDGSGVTMLLLSMPMTVLYGAGLGLTRGIDKRRNDTHTW